MSPVRSNPEHPGNTLRWDYDRVTKTIPVLGEAEVRFEHGNARTPALHDHLGHLNARAERVVVHLKTPGVQCKARDGCGVPAETGSDADGCAPAPAGPMTLG